MGACNPFPVDHRFDTDQVRWEPDRHGTADRTSCGTKQSLHVWRHGCRYSADLLQWMQAHALTLSGRVRLRASGLRQPFTAQRDRGIGCPETPKPHIPGCRCSDMRVSCFAGMLALALMPVLPRARLSRRPQPEATPPAPTRRRCCPPVAAPRRARILRRSGRARDAGPWSTILCGDDDADRRAHFPAICRPARLFGGSVS